MRKLVQVGKLSRLLMIAALCAVSLGAAAQTKTVKGVITDTKNEPLVGASVVVKGTKTSATTDIDGNYSINAAEGATLVVSYIGMITKEVPVTGKEVNVALDDDAVQLDEVVFIGYATVKKRDLTGAVSSIGAKELASIPVATAAEALTGKLAGVQVTTTEGSPDADIKIRVRGGGSITRDNSPLYIVDGFPVSSISDIPPTDIQSMDVLKDASSTAIYGARGANGVIIITTKSSKEGKLTVNYNGYFGIKNVTKTLDVMSPYEFALLQYETALLQNKIMDNYEPYFGVYNDINLYKSMQGTNWQDVVFGRTGTTWNNSLSVTGGGKTASFNASYSRVDDKAIMLGSSYTRDNLSLKVNATPLDWVKLNFTTRYSVTTTYGAGANDVSGSERSTNDSRVKNAVIYSPIPLKKNTAADDDADVIGNLYPPTVQVADNDRFRKRHILNINGGFSLDFMKNLVWRTELGIDQIFNEDNRYYGKSTYFVNGGGGTVGKPAGQLSSGKSSTFRNTNTLSYYFDLKKDHHFSLMAGEESLVTSSQAITALLDNYPDFFDSNMVWSFTSQGTPISTDNFYSPDDKLISFFGRANYDYLGRYLLTVTFRADGSSKFAPGNQWGYFPSVAAAWRISDESFMKDVSWVSSLKLRASLGLAGNNNIPALSYMQVYASGNTTYLPFTGSYWGVKKSDGKTTMSNEDLKWETTTTRNTGIDFGFLNNRITGTIDLYWNSTNDLLINYPTTGSGYSTQLRNIGETSNKGIELSLNAVILDTKGFRLDFNFNIGANVNRVEDLGGLAQLDGISSGWSKATYATPDYLVRLNEPVGQMFGFVTEGMYGVDDFTWNGSKWVAKPGIVDNSALCGNSWGPGALKLKDLDGNGKIDANDKTVIGDAMPKHTGGFGFNASYMGFDFTANFNWVYGNNILNANKIEFTSTANYTNRNMLAGFNYGTRFSQLDATTGQRVTDPAKLSAMNANASIWSPIMDAGSNSYPLHSWAVEDGSFLRLNNVTLGYTLPEAITRKFYVQQLRVYVSAYNLWTLTNYSGYDPEVDSRRSSPMTPGVDYSAYPKSRAFNFGVNITL